MRLAINNVTSGLLVALIIVASIAGYQQVLFNTTFRSFPTYTSTTTVTATATTISTQVVMVISTVTTGPKGNVTTITTQEQEQTLWLPNSNLLKIPQGEFAMSSLINNPMNFDNVIFKEYTYSNITNTGFNCIGGGYTQVFITFKDGKTETLSPCFLLLGDNSTIYIRLTQHTNPQAGLLLVTSSGEVFLLVSQ